MDYPRIPLPGGREIFAALVELGARLTALHLMEADGAEKPRFEISGGNDLKHPRYKPSPDGNSGRVWINETQYFDGVSGQTWEFSIGGYRPAERWLRDRRGRQLSFEDVEHYRGICAALAETPRLMEQIDAVIDEHGGWPLARAAAE